jgi:hypothetical protein
MWGEIMNAESLPDSMGMPAFDRVERVAQELLISASCSLEEETPGSKECGWIKEENVGFL